MIKLQDLTKQYDKFLAVDHLNLTIETGEFFGLLGPNGAGKTTTISMLSTLLLPTADTPRRTDTYRNDKYHGDRWPPQDRGWRKASRRRSGG